MYFIEFWWIASLFIIIVVLPKQMRWIHMFLSDKVSGKILHS